MKALKLIGKKAIISTFGNFNLRILLSFVLCSVGAVLALGSLAVSGIAGGSVAESSLVAPTVDDGSIAPSPNATETDSTAFGVASPTSAPFFPNILYGVSCTSASDCWTVGYWTSVAPFRALIEHWDGASWMIVDSPDVNGGENNVLFAVTCTSQSDCWAVGQQRTCVANEPDSLPSLVDQTLIEHWDGSGWAVVSSPNALDYPNNYLVGVTCTSASDCWAIGWYSDNSNRDKTLTEHWDGSSWSIVPSPNEPANMDSRLLGVACAGSSDCWAVGYGGSGSQTLVEHWDGSSWTIIDSPYAGPGQLAAVTCTSASDCWAVGTGSQTLVEHWDGSSWMIISSPINPYAGRLASVECASPSDCWAVGWYSDTSENREKTMTEHWDGASWSILPSPNVGGARFSNFLAGVTCTSGSNCRAVGHVDPVAGSGRWSTVTLYWDGSAWAVVSSPNVLSGPPSTIPVFVYTNTACFTFMVDNIGYSAPQLLYWAPGSAHTIATTSPQSVGTGAVHVDELERWRRHLAHGGAHYQHRLFREVR